MTNTEDNASGGTEKSDCSNATHKRKEPSRQEKVARGIQISKQMASIEHCQRVLKVFTTNPMGAEFWKRGEYKMIRECLEVMKSHPEKYSPIMGDKMPDGSYVGEGNSDDAKTSTPGLTPNYIVSIATHKDLGFADSPVLQVVSRPKMEFEGNSNANHSNKLHFTNLRLRDGNDDIMIGRLSMHLAHDGNRLDDGDIIELNLFTPCTYPPSGKDKPQRSPMVVIHRYSIVGTAALPLKRLNDPINCTPLTDGEIAESLNKVSQLPAGCVVLSEEGGEEMKEENGKRYERLLEVDCTHDKRYCSLYGLSTIQCVCKTDPIANIDLEVVRMYCWFATKDVCKMDNSNKRNMLYWWYMTNIYTVCGKGRRKDPPACLKAAIRKAYPAPDSWYVVYVPGKKKN